MSNFDFSTLITDRTAADVKAGNAKGTYNATDLNRVGEAVRYLAGIYAERGYVVPVAPKVDWQESDWPPPSAMARYLQDVETLREQVPMLDGTPETPETMEKLTHLTANNIEQILLDCEDMLRRMELAWFCSGEIYCGEV